MFDVKTYEPAGPVMHAFHACGSFTRLLDGPIGSSKTTGAGVADVIGTAMLQRPEPDGVRRAKVGVLRDTYRNLYATFIPTWFRWIPRELGRFVGSDDRPAIHTFDINTPVGPCELSVEMRALGPNTVEAVCRGWELTGCYLDEVDLMPREALSFLAGRVMRYPDKQYRNSRGVWATFNRPDTDHWLYQMCVDEYKGPTADFAYFSQPGGLLPGQPLRVNPAAENLANLDADYYLRAAAGQPEWYVRRMIRNQWGASVSGDPIFPEFRDDLHVLTEELQPGPRDVLEIGVDGGGTPAAQIWGTDERTGRRIQYAEVVLVDLADPRGRRLATGVGPKRFAAALKDVLVQRFPRNPVRMIWGDPASQYGADREAGEYSWLEILAHELGLPVQPAPSNEIGLRLEAVRGLLTTLCADGRPKLMINPSCKWTRRGYVSDYKWEEVDPKQPGKKLKPQKTSTSHVHDAGQYVALGSQGRAGVVSGQRFDQRILSARARDLDTGIWSQIDDANRQNQGVYGVSQFYDTGFDLWKS